MAITLVISSQGNPSETITLDQPRVVIGRGAHADVRLPSRAVSDLHAVLKVEVGEVVLIDEGSTNGTRVNGVAIPRGRRKSLRSGDVLQVASYEIKIELAPAMPDPPERTGSLARKLLLDALAQVGGETAPPRLTLTTGRKAGVVWVFPAAPSRFVLGRADGCEVLLDDPDCSRQHAELTRDSEGVTARDLGSKNGFFIADRRVTERRMRHGDELTIGRTTLRFEDPTEELLRSLEQGPDEPAPTPPPPAPPPPPPEPEAPPAVVSTPPAETSSPPATNSAPPAVKSNPGATRPLARKRSASIDWIVVALAVVILAVSVAALWLVLRSTPSVNTRSPAGQHTARGAD